MQHESQHASNLQRPPGFRTSPMLLPPPINITITISNKLSIKTGPFFPFLDVELSWHVQGDLRWSVFRKPNQVLKYVPRQSTHSGVTHAAITKGLFKRLTRLATILAKNGDLPLDRYAHHASALRKASLAPKIFPSLNEIAAAKPPSQKKRKLTAERYGFASDIRSFGGFLFI
mmetsp:Transcript_40252/g.49038  ORF Transcript_40252/g.49038 Transcript_40252/m.49038 type:complete len:173 (+) Transcript_40252:1012-1530(+)